MRHLDLSRAEEERIAEGLSNLVQSYLLLAEERMDEGDTFMAREYITKANQAHSPLWQFSQEQSTLLELQIIGLEARITQGHEDFVRAVVG